MQEESFLRHLRDNASYCGSARPSPGFEFADHALGKDAAAARSLVEAFVFLFQHTGFFRDLVEDTQYFERLRQAVLQRRDLECLLPMVAVFNLMADTFHSTGERQPSASEFFSLMKDQSDAGIGQLEQLVRVVSQSFRFFCLSVLETLTVQEILLRFKHLSSGLQSGRVFLPDAFVVAFAQDLAADPVEVKKAFDGQNLQQLQAWLERLEPQDRRDSQLARYFYLEEIGRGSHLASEMLDLLRDWYCAPMARLLQQGFGQATAGLSEVSVPLYRDKLVFRRFDLRGNGNFGFMDLSRLDYTTQKNSVMIDMLYPNRKTARLAIEKYKVDLLKDFVLKTDLYQDTAYFKRPRFRDLIRKINETKDSQDFLNDYDIAVFFEKEARDCRKTYLWYYLLGDRVSELVEQSSTGIPRVKAYCLDNRRLVAREAVKVVYSIKRYSFNEESTSFMVYLPEDNEETVGDFVDYLLKTHFRSSLPLDAAADSLRRDVFQALEFSFLSNLSFEQDPALFTQKTGLTTTTTFLDLAAALRSLSPELAGESLPEGPQRDLLINCYFARSLLEKYGEGRFATDPIENNLKTKIEASAHLTDLVDYLIHNHQFTSKDRPAQVVHGRQSHADLRSLPTGALLPSVIVVCVSRINSSLEFSAPFEFECLALDECRQQLALNRSYQMTAMLCRKKQAAPNSPLLFYPVVKAAHSKNDEMVGYMPKEGRAPLSKFKKEQIDFVLLSRVPFSYFD